MGLLLLTFFYLPHIYNLLYAYFLMKWRLYMKANGQMRHSFFICACYFYFCMLEMLHNRISIIEIDTHPFIEHNMLCFYFIVSVQVIVRIFIIPNRAQFLKNHIDTCIHVIFSLKIYLIKNRIYFR